MTEGACCICLEEKSIYIQCAHCVNGSVCRECSNELLLSENIEMCPVCRQTQWNNVEIYIPQEMPEQHADGYVVFEPTIYVQPPLSNVRICCWFVSVMLMLGSFFTLVMLIPHE